MIRLCDYSDECQLIGGEDENTFGGYGGGAEEAGATLVPVQPCIVLDARNQSKDNSVLRMSLWYGFQIIDELIHTETVLKEQLS